MEQTNSVKLKEKTILSSKKRDAIFCALVLLYPVVQFCIFYIYVNISSVALAFQNQFNGQMIFAGFYQFSQVFYNFTQETSLIYSISNSLIAYFVGLLISEPLAIIFSFSIYKKVAGYKFFRVMLFLPSIISSLVLVLIYRYFVENIIPEVWQMIFGTKVNLMDPNTTAFATILFFSTFIGCGGRTLMYTSTMGGINESIVESAQLDGVGFVGELWHITLPSIYPTIVTFIVAGIATIFTNELGLFSFYSTEADYKLYTFGYYIYRNTQLSADGSKYPYLSSLGLLLSCIAIPLTLLVKKCMEKFGPSAE